MCGFTLIEVIVALAMLILIVMNTLPVAATWNETMSITDTKGKLKQALTLARTASQFNVAGRALHEASAVVCIEESNIVVRLAAVDRLAQCSDQNEIRWQAVLRPGVELKVTEGDELTAFDCMCYRPSGLTSIDGACAACSQTSFITIVKGASSDLYKAS